MINQQYPAPPLQYLRGGLRLKFTDGIKMLQARAPLRPSFMPHRQRDAARWWIYSGSVVVFSAPHQ